MVDVLYILGTQRSGSTAFERFLVSHEGTVGIGEARSLWSQRSDRTRPCSCGRTVAECPFWTRVRIDAFGPSGDLDGETLRAVRQHVDRPQYVPMMHHPILRTPRFKRLFPIAQDVVRRFYEAIARAAPGRVVIDSTKVPWYGHLLMTIPGVRVAFVHLVRDSRAVAFSAQRARGDAPLRTALAWDMKFVLAAVLPLYAKARVMHLRYEDFARNPVRSAVRVQELLDRSGMPLLGPRHDDVDREWYHVGVGNRMRYTPDFVIQPDEEWHSSFPVHHKALVGAVTLPFLAWRRRYADS